MKMFANLKLGKRWLTVGAVVALAAAVQSAPGPLNSASKTNAVAAKAPAAAKPQTAVTAAPAKPAAKAGKAYTPPGMTFPAEYPGPLLKQMLAGPLKDTEEIVFAVRVPGRDHWYVTFGNYADYSEEAQTLGFKKEDGVYWGYGEGGRLCRMNLRTGAVKDILADPKGGIRDPQVHYDGNKILFAYRKGGEHPFHLYEINVDGTGLRQLTDGPDDDIEPTYCPDGSIVFTSSRCRRYVNCWHTRVATLHRCDGDGKNVRMLSTNNDHDNTPWVLPDGRLLYMRWEYVDRSQLDFHHLWTMNPDGTSQNVFFGNMKGGMVMLDAKPIPGTTKIVASFSPGHGRPEHLGPITILDGSNGPDDPTSYRTVSKSGDYKDPYPVTETCFLVAHAKGLFVMDGEGNAERIFALPDDPKQLQCHEPRPIQPRERERVIPARVELSQATGRLFLQDIYTGRNMSGVKRGSIKKLLVLQQLPKPVNFSGGMEPLTIGGSFTLAEIVGEAPVEPDGSAFLELPALRSLFFVALDENDRSVKRMHSFVTLQPGETTGCVGCHEQRTQAALPNNLSLMAMKKLPVPVKPIKDVPSVLDFPRDIQPILDRRCVSCHNSDKRDGKVDLCGDKTSMYTISYWTINQRGLVTDGRNQPHGNREPYSYGSAASRLMKLADGSHYNAKLTEHEMKLLRLWIETSATYPGTYASLGCGSYPVGVGGSPQVMQRCGSCHSVTHKDRLGKEFTALTILGRYGHALESIQNISNPERALIVRAPLAKEAGGLGLCKQVSFKDKNDPLYKSMLAMLQNAHDRLEQGKRFDMPGFRPNEHYLREMQRFGILPKDLGPNTPVDIYATDRAYWDSFYYKPPTEVRAGNAPHASTGTAVVTPSL
ncbi:MAG: hypothetical protein WCO56_01960 [Verrucomicrobiota bacterium]